MPEGDTIFRTARALGRALTGKTITGFRSTYPLLTRFNDDTPLIGQIVEQVYFCGVHCDVGGGYPDDAGTGTALSDITLSWMMAKARALGLVFDPGVAARFPSPIDKKFSLDTKHESWSPLWLFPKSRDIAPAATLANSVEVRCQNDSSYRPGSLSLANGLPGPAYGREVVVA